MDKNVVAYAQTQRKKKIEKKMNEKESKEERRTFGKEWVGGKGQEEKEGRKDRKKNRLLARMDGGRRSYHRR